MFGINVPLLSGPVLGTALLIFVLRVVDVSMGTMRMIMITRGMRAWSALIGFVEVTIWVVAISQVITHLDSVWNILAYSGGFAAGTLLGMWMEGKLALGHVVVSLISMTKGPQLAQAIRKAGYGATELQASGHSGPVSLIEVVVPRKQLPEVIRLANAVDPASFVTVDDERQVMRGYYRVRR